METPKKSFGLEPDFPGGLMQPRIKNWLGLLIITVTTAGLVYSCSSGNKKARVFIGTPEEVRAWKQSSQPATYRSIDRQQKRRASRKDDDSEARDIYINPSTGTVIKREIVQDALDGDREARKYIDTVIDREKLKIKHERERTREQWTSGGISRQEKLRRNQDQRARDKQLDATKKYIRSRD